LDLNDENKNIKNSALSQNFETNYNEQYGNRNCPLSSESIHFLKLKRFIINLIPQLLSLNLRDFNLCQGYF